MKTGTPDEWSAAQAPTKTLALPAPARQTLGCDVSSVQPPVDWAAVYAAGFRFAYVKATDGVRDIDPMFARHVAGARAAGLLVGAYHFLSPGLGPAAQAKHFHDAVETAGPGLWLPPCVDFEYPAPEDWAAKGLDGARLCQIAATFVQVAEPLFDRKLALYTYPYFWGKLPVADANLQEVVKRCYLWLASYVQGGPILPRPFGSWAFWQTSGNGGKVPGVPGDCDRDVFNGTLDELTALAA